MAGECIEKHPVNGSYIVSDIIDGQRVQRVYFYYTKRECLRMFREETNKKKH